MRRLLRLRADDERHDRRYLAVENVDEEVVLARFVRALEDVEEPDEVVVVIRGGVTEGRLRMRQGDVKIAIEAGDERQGAAIGQRDVG